MILSLSYPAPVKKQRLSIMLLAAYGVLIALSLTDFLPWFSVNFITGLAAMPFAIDPNRQGKHAVLYAVVAVCFTALSCLMPENNLYFAIIAAMFFIVEQGVARVSMAAWVIAFLMSPVMNYIVTVFSFPIRMQLTVIAGKLFGWMGVKANVTGNIIRTGGTEFAVDPACMGLNMLLSSLLCGLLILVLTQKKYSKKLSAISLATCMLFVLTCNILSNLIRIILLVHFQLLPDNPMHELLGTLCFLLYIILPSLWFIKWMVIKFGVTDKNNETKIITRKKQLLLPLALLILLSVSAGIHYNHEHGIANPVTLQGYQTTVLDDVVKYQGRNSLVYFKKIKGAFYPEHNPLICWTGSGYSFEGLQMKSYGSMSYYTGILKKGQEKLYTAWWFDNGKKRTASQLEWRWDDLKGAPHYAVINITMAGKASLDQEIQNIVTENRFAGVFRN